MGCHGNSGGRSCSQLVKDFVYMHTFQKTWLVQILKTVALPLKHLTLTTDSNSGGHLLNVILQSMLLKQSGKNTARIAELTVVSP